MNHKRNVLYLIAVTVILKFLLATFLQLGNDEVYYIVYTHHLKLNYFDHPPFVAFVLKLFSLDLWLKNEAFLRLGFIFCGAVATWLMFLIGAKIYNPRAGWFAALLYSASVYGNIISGFMIMPDGPMAVFWLSALYFAINAVQIAGKKRNGYLLLFGLAAGLSIMGKVSSAMLWVGLGGYALFSDRAMLKNLSFYLAALITILIISPVLWELVMQQAAGADYHANRVAIHQLTSVRLDSFMRQVLGEFGYNNPIVYVLSLVGLSYCLKKKLLPAKTNQLLLFFALPLIAMVWFFSLFNNTLPHWTGASFLTLIFFGAVFIAHKTELFANKKLLKWVYAANGIVAALMIFIVIAVNFLPVGFNAKENLKSGKGDLLLDFSGWKQLGKDFKNIHEQDIAEGLMKQNSFLLSSYWFPAAHIDWYVAEANKYPFMAVGSLYDIHEYAWLNARRRQLKPGDDAYFISISNYYNRPDSLLFDHFSFVEKTDTIVQKRAGVPVRNFYITRLKNYKGGIPENGLIK